MIFSMKSEIFILSSDSPKLIGLAPCVKTVIKNIFELIYEVYENRESACLNSP